MSAKDPRWVRERQVKNRESCCVIDLGRIGLVRYMLYQSVGIQVANSLSRHAAIIRNTITPSQIARLPVHKLWEVAGMVVPFIQALCASRIGLSDVHAASTSEGIIFVKS